MSELITLFATPPLLVKKYDKNLNKIVSYCDTLRYYNSHTNFSSENTFILNEPEFVDVKNFIELSLQEYVLKVFSTNHQFVITQSWVTKNLRSNSQEIHTHPGSVVSGVFYIKCPQNSGDIEFNRGKSVFEIQVNEKCQNSWISDRYTYPSKTGNLLLFPSNLLHSVRSNESEEERYSLAFNSFPTLPVGHIDFLTYLY